MFVSTLAFKPHGVPAPTPPPDNATAIVLGLALGACVLIAAAIAVAYLVARYDRSITGGLYFWERRRLEREGTPAHAVVLDALEVSWSSSGRLIYRLMDFVLEVETEPRWRASLRYRLTFSDWTDAKAGVRVPVRFDQNDRKRILIDWNEMHRAQRALDAQDHAAQVARHAALLDPNQRR